jgi:hypothetical protein
MSHPFLFGMEFQQSIKGNKMMKYFLLMILFASLFLLMCCKDEPTKPPNEIIKNPREYTWTIDTLAYPGSMQTNMRDIWASSPTDVYVVGHNDQPGPGTMFHYNGNTWTTTHFHSADGGSISGAVDLHSLYGFSANDIYVTGERLYSNPLPPPNFLSTSLVIHFDGVSWKEISLTDSNLIETVWGNKADGIICSGFKGIIYNYKSNLWHRDSLNIIRSQGWYTQVNSLSGSSSGLSYALANSQQNGSPDLTMYFAIRQQGTWSVVDTFVYGPSNLIFKWGISKIWVSPTDRVFSLGPDLFEWNGSSWMLIQHTDGSYLRTIYGTSNNNLFIGGTYGTLLHYNGVDWYSFDQFKTLDVNFTGIWTDGKEAFVIGTTSGGSKTIIFHGK